MKLSIFTTMTHPIARGDNYADALDCYEELADEVVIVNGDPVHHKAIPLGKIKVVDSEWPKEFEWPLIGQQFTKGYQAATGDWVIHMDLDFIFHQDDFRQIRSMCEANPNAPGLSFWKWQFIYPDRYNLKSRLVLAVNKKLCGDRIKFNSGGDLCQPSLDGAEIVHDGIPEARVPIYNYEKMTKTLNQVMDDCGRMERASFRTFGRYQMGSDGTDESAFNRYIQLLRSRVNKPQEHIGINQHPKFVRETIKSLTPEQFGYNCFDLFGKNGYIHKRAMG